MDIRGDWLIRLFTPLRICFNSFIMLSSTKMGKTQPIRIVIRLINKTKKRERREKKSGGLKEKGGNDNLDN